jgi:hypothetical protein
VHVVCLVILLSLISRKSFGQWHAMDTIVSKPHFETRNRTRTGTRTISSSAPDSEYQCVWNIWSMGYMSGVPDIPIHWVPDIYLKYVTYSWSTRHTRIPDIPIHWVPDIYLKYVTYSWSTRHTRITCHNMAYLTHRWHLNGVSIYSNCITIRASLEQNKHVQEKKTRSTIHWIEFIRIKVHKS